MIFFEDYAVYSHNKYAYIHTYMFMQHHNDTIIKQTHEGRRRKTQEDFFNNILLPLTLLQGFERVVQGLHVRGSWRPNINCNILTPLL